MGFFGDLLEETGLSGLLSDGQWRTMKYGKRVKIDTAGRIVAGLPSKYHGTHIRDLGKLTHEERELQGIDCEESGHCHTCRKTFRTKDEAVQALLAANPRFDELRQSEHGAYDSAFVKWQRGGRRGPKPRTKITDGRLDAINEHYDLRASPRPLTTPRPRRGSGPTSRNGCSRCRRRPASRSIPPTKRCSCPRPS
jgi:hypothetical protein